MTKIRAATLTACVAVLGCSSPDVPHQGQPSQGVASVIHSNPLQGSPVRGAPGELLLVAGEGLTSTMVVYYKRVNGAETPFGCFGSHARAAAYINDAHIANTVLKGNSVIDCSNELFDQGSGTVVLP